MTQPPIDIDKIDFSRFHPIDHYPWTARCRSLYGGGFYHVRIWWGHIGRQYLRAWTVCRLGRHQPVRAWREDPKKFSVVCRNCGKPLSQTR